MRASKSAAAQVQGKNHAMPRTKAEKADPSAPAKRAERIDRAAGRGGPRPAGRDDRFVGAASQRSGGKPCPCDGEPRKAVAVDPAIKEANRKRLRRIEGQVRGLQKMVEGDRYCADIITQVASVQEALRGVARNLMRNHLRHCAAKALRSGRPDEAEAMYDELLNLIYAHLR